MSTTYTGMDIGSSQFHLTALDQQDHQVMDRQIQHGQNREETARKLVKQINKLPEPVHLHFEECDMSGWLYDLLGDHAEEIVVSDPLYNRWIGSDPDKEDRLDAYKLAELLRMDNYRSVYVSGCQDRREFKRLVSHREQFKKKEVRLLNQIKAELRREGIIVRANTNWPDDKKNRYLRKLPTRMQALLGQKFELLEKIQEMRKQAQKIMKAAGRHFSEMDRLKQAPGVGDVLASRFIAAIQNPHRFPNKRKLIRYCGLAVVNQKSDGTPLGYERLNQDGVTELKTVSNIIYRTAVKRMETDNGFKRFYKQSLNRTGDATNARLNTQRKIVVVLWTIWKNKQPYQDSNVCG